MRQAIDLAIANAIVEGIDDVFARPFELDLLADDARLRAAVRQRVYARIVSDPFDSEEFYPLETILMPKRQPFEYRACAVLEPIDAIAYLALALLAADAIENARIPARADVVFSYRLRPRDGLVFDPAFSYRTFLRHVNAAVEARQAGVVITADIESFYDRIAFARLEDALNACGVAPSVTHRLLSLLSHWAKGGDRGLPVGSNASRILAEALLVPVDRRLLHAGATFARYVDDYRFLAPDAATAHRWLNNLQQTLTSDGLTLNGRKTQLLSAATLQQHLATERARIEMCAAKTSKKPKSGKAPTGTNGSTEPAPFPTPPNRPEKGSEPDASQRYSGLMPQEYVAPDEQEQIALRGVRIDEWFASVADDPSAEHVSTYVRAALSGRQDQAVRRLIDLIGLAPQSTAYVVSALVATAPELSPLVRSHVADSAEELLLSADPLPDAAAIHLVALLGHPMYRRERALVRFYNAQAANTGSYLRRATLDALGPTRRWEVTTTGALPPRIRRALTAAGIECGVQTVREDTTDPFLLAVERRYSVA